MKTMQGFVGLLTAALLSACSMQGLAPAEAAVPSTAPPTPTPLPSTAAPTYTPRPTPTPTVAVSFLCPPGSSPTTEWECQQHVSTRTCTSLSSSESEWACYEDVKYGFALEYPSDWEASMPFDYGSSNGVTIIRRHSFMGAPRGALDVDIWPMSERDLKTWLEEQNKVAELSPVVEPNARVAGYPAVVFVDDPTTTSPMFSVFVSNGTYAYRLWFTLQCDEEEAAIMHRIVDSFRFSAESVPAEIPDAVWQEVERAFEPPRCAGDE